MFQIRHISIPVIFIYLLQLSPVGYSIGNPEDVAGNVREYYSSNWQNRFRIRIQLWGDVPLSGTHYVEDKATLLELLGYAGGTTGVLSKTDISVVRLTQNSAEKINIRPDTIRIRGTDLMSGKFRDFQLAQGDMIYVDSTPKTDTFLRVLTVTSSILGIVASSIALYFVFNR